MPLLSKSLKKQLHNLALPLLSLHHKKGTNQRDQSRSGIQRRAVTANMQPSCDIIEKLVLVMVDQSDFDYSLN